MPRRILGGEYRLVEIGQERKKGVRRKCRPINGRIGATEVERRAGACMRVLRARSRVSHPWRKPVKGEKEALNESLSPSFSHAGAKAAAALLAKERTSERDLNIASVQLNEGGRPERQRERDAPSLLNSASHFYDFIIGSYAHDIYATPRDIFHGATRRL